VKLGYDISSGGAPSTDQTGQDTLSSDQIGGFVHCIAVNLAGPPQDNGEQPLFRTPDKRLCGFLLLRALRTGSRALSLERGSLLDIILRVHELRPKMWEKVLEQLRDLPVTADPELGVTQILSGVQAALRTFVPSEWAAEPHLRVSDLTRENLRRTLTVFMATGAMNGDIPHSAPFQHQGSGDQYARARVTIDDRRREKDRHLRDGGA
jgi:hypothetical protein